MKFGELFDHIILCAQESKTLYELNAESESFARLDEIVKSINLLREFYDKYETLRVQSRVGGPFSPEALRGHGTVPASSIVRKGKQKHEDDANALGQLVGTQGPDAGGASKRRRKEEDAIGEGEVPDDVVHSALEVAADVLDKELKIKLEKALLHFLEKVCADDMYTDATGMKLHHTVSDNTRPRKAIKEGIYFPYRLRIGPLTNAFTDDVKRAGTLPDDENLPVIIKSFLATSRFFKRFNEQNKRLKMRGVHVWTVEAANTLHGRWSFHDHPRRFISDPPGTATVGQRFTYVPKVWDPELCEPEVFITSTHLPPWLTLVNNILLGVPDETAETTEIRLTAFTLPGGRGRKHRDPSRMVEQIFKLHILRPEMGAPAASAAGSAGGHSDAAEAGPSTRPIVVPVARRAAGGSSASS